MERKGVLSGKSGIDVNALRPRNSESYICLRFIPETPKQPNIPSEGSHKTTLKAVAISGFAILPPNLLMGLWAM
jgi:hypothetical protein